MAKLKLTKNEQKVQKDALKMYQRYLPTLTLKKQQLQSEIRTIDAKAKEVVDVFSDYLAMGLAQVAQVMVNYTNAVQ